MMMSKDEVKPLFTLIRQGVRVHHMDSGEAINEAEAALNAALKPPLSELLRDWTDFDLAEFYVGVSVGLWENNAEIFQANKATFWSNNEFGNALMMVLMALVEAGKIEESESYGKFRWKP